MIRIISSHRLPVITALMILGIAGLVISRSFAFKAISSRSAVPTVASGQESHSRAYSKKSIDVLKFAGLRNHAAPLNPASPFAPTVSATKSDSLFTDVDGDLQADPGDTLKYTVNIGATGDDATGVSFTDTVDPNTTFVPGSLTATPVAVDDSYAALGNVRISVPAPGVRGNDFDGVPSATASAPATSANGGNVAMNADGSFTYNPPAGFEGSDTFNYTLTNAAGSNSGTVTITVSGMIWFINNNPGACVSSCDGRLTNPFTTLGAFAAVNNGAGNNPAANDNIFLYESAVDYVGPVTLLSGQRFIGQDATASLSAITGLTPPTYSDPLPVMNSGNAIVTNITSAGNSINVGSGNTLRGFTGGNSVTDINGTGFGTLTIADVTLNGTGQALNLTTGTLAATFVSISSTASTTTGISLTGVAGSLTTPTTTVTNPAGIGISVNTSTATLNFGNTSSTLSGGTGVSLLTNSGTITFGSLDISAAANQRGLLATDNSNTITSTSGTVITTGAPAVEITRGVGTTPLVMSLTSVSATGDLNGIKLTNTSGSFTVTGDGSTTAGLLDRDGSGGTITGTSGDSVLLTNTQNVTLRQMNITSAALDAVEATGGANVILSAVDINTPGATNPAAVGGFGSGNGLRATNVTGNIFFDNNSRVINWQSSQSNAVLLNQTNTNFSSFTVDNAFITTSATGAAGIHANLNGATTGMVTITDTDLTLIDQNAAQIVNNGSGTITSLVQRNNFHDADATGGDGNNTFLLILTGSGQMNFTIGGPSAADGNAFTNLARLSANAGVLQVQAAGGTATAGAKLNGSIQNNTLTNPAFVSQRRGINAVAEASSGNHGGHSIFIGNNSIQNFQQQGIYSLMSTVNGAATANDNLNNNITISNNLVGNISPIGQGGGDGGSAIEVETLNGTPSVGSDISVNVLIQNNTAVSNNSSGIGDAMEINSSGNGAPNTSVVNLTALGNSITQSNAGGSVFEARALTNSASQMCLDLNAGNTSPNTATGGTLGFRITQDAAAGAYSIDGMAAGPQTAAAVQTFLAARNTGAVTAASGGTGFVGAPGGCANATLPSALAAPVSEEFARYAPTENLDNQTATKAPAGDSGDVLFAADSQSANRTNAIRLQREWLISTVLPAAIERWRQAGINAEDLARLQAVTFEVADLADGQLATTTSTHLKIDATAAGYGWYVDLAPMDDDEFDVPVPGRELQTTEYSVAHGRGVDVLTVVMRQLGAVYLQGKSSIPKQLERLMQNTLSPGVRRFPRSQGKQRQRSSGSLSRANQPGKEKSLVDRAGKASALRSKTGAKSPVSFSKAGFNSIAKTVSRQSSRLMHHAPMNRTTAASLSSMLADVMLNIGTLPAGESVTITFKVTVDDPFTGALPQVSNQGTVSGTNFADVLTDDPTVGGTADPTVTPIDLAQVSVAVSPSSVAEDGAANLVYTFTRTGSTVNAVTVNFSVGGTASFTEPDYTQTGAATFTATSGTVVIPSGSSTATVTIDPSADNTVESDETVNLTVTPGTGYGVGSPSAASGTITNDDADVTVAVSPSSVAEDGATNLVYTFTRTGFTGGALTVNFSVGGSASFPGDYSQTGATTFTPPTGTVTFAALSSTATVTIDPAADNTVEGDETVDIALTPGAGYTVGSPSAASGTITNDDATVTLAVSPSSVAEDGAANLVYTFTRDNLSGAALTVNFSVGGSASFPGDYSQSGATTFTPPTGTVTFAAGSLTATVTIDPTADNTVESDETVDIALTSGTGYTIGSPSAAQGTITNDDADVTLTVSPSSVSEDGATNLVYTFTRSNISGGALTVNFSVGGSASFPGDYSQSGATTFTPPTGTVTFAASSLTATVTIDPTADNTVEGDETVDIAVTSGTGYTIGSPSAASGTITNDDADVTLTLSPSSVSEDGATNLVYTFTRSNISGGALTVNFSVGGSASFPGDYSQSGATTFTPPTGTVTFAAMSSTATVTIDPTADNTVESDETVDIALTSGTGYTVGSPSAAQGTITNDDADVSVAVSPSSVAEDGATNLVYTFTRTGFTGSALAVNFSVGGSAGFPTDYSQSGATTYSSSSGTVTFGMGNNTAMVTIDPASDTTIESDETVILTSTSGTGYNVSSPSSATGTITNDDADVSVTVAPASVAEDGAANLVYTFTRSNISGGALTVNFSVGGTATFGASPDDYTQTGATTYTTTSGTVTFAPGSLTATVTVNPETDVTNEPDETIVITLTAGASYNAVSPNSATGTILNDDTLVSVAVAPSSTAEGGANLVYTFTRTGPTGSALTVNFSVGGTASFPADYTQSGAATFTPPTATVTFGAGNSTATVNVTPLSDCTVEGSETVVFTVTPGTGYGVGSPSSATGTITNTPDTTPPVISGVSASPSTLSPPNHQMEDVTINYTATDNCGSANCVISNITSNQPINGTGDGDTAPDWEFVDAHHVRLRAERASGSARVYTITITCTDSFGNISTSQVQVTVP
jgi:hypothetical protein